MLAPRSHNALLKDLFLTMQDKKKLLVSFDFGGNLFWEIMLDSSETY